MRVDALVAFLLALATGETRPCPAHTVVELAPTIPGLSTFNARALSSGRVSVAVRRHGLLILHVWEPPRSLHRVA